MTIAAPITKEPQVKSQSLYQVAWRQFRKHRLARLGVFILGVLYMLALFAGFIAPYDPNAYDSGENRVSWASPTAIHIKDTHAKYSGPFIYGSKPIPDPTNEFRTIYTEDKETKYPLQFFVHNPDAPYKLLGFIPSDLHLFKVDGPKRLFLWGSDNMGRDQFSRILYGSQFSLTIGIFATFLSVILGMFFGGLAGYFRGWTDIIIMRLIEVLSAIPDLFLLIALRAVFPVDANPVLIMYLIVGILALVGWGGIARTVRSQLLSIRELDYVQAAQSLGAKDSRIIWRHMLPNTFSFLIVAISMLIPSYILMESGLSFLGIGIVEPYASWGSLLKLVQDGGFESMTGRPWVLIPGIFIFLAVLAWQFVGDGLRDAFDPRKRQ